MAHSPPEDDSSVKPSAPVAEAPAGIDEQAWLDVIHRMDEVYSRLVQDEIELEAKNSELLASNQLISGVMAAMSDALLACDEIGRIQQTNPALQALIGSDGTSLEGLAVETLLAISDDKERLRQLMRAAQDQPPAPLAQELQLRNAEGLGIPVELRCTARRDHAGHVVGFVMVGRPIGELRLAYQQLSRAHDELKATQQQLLHSEKMASLGRLVAGVAHELNNPISFILGNAHALARYAERVSEYLRQIHAEPQSAPVRAARERLRIDRIINDLPDLIEGTLDGSKRSAAIVAALKRFSSTENEPVERLAVRPIIDQASHWLGKSQIQRIRIRNEIGPDTYALASGGQLLQVCMNLIENAAHALYAAETPDPELHISAAVKGQQIEIRFHDNGPGVAPQLRRRIFDPFFTTKSAGHGTGLGLSICDRIIEQLGGNLSLDERAEVGACFVVTLPVT